MKACLVLLLALACCGNTPYALEAGDYDTMMRLDHNTFPDTEDIYVEGDYLYVPIKLGHEPDDSCWVYFPTGLLAKGFYGPYGGIIFERTWPCFGTGYDRAYFFMWITPGDGGFFGEGELQVRDSCAQEEPYIQTWMMWGTPAKPDRGTEDATVHQ